MKVRMLVSIEGTFENVYGGVKRGQQVTISDASLDRYLAAGLVTTALTGDLPEPFKRAV